MGFTLPILWDGTIQNLPGTIEEILLRALEIVESGNKPKTTVSVAAIVSKSSQRQELSSTILLEIKSFAMKHNFGKVIIPVRPIWKERYPLIPMEQYIQWTKN